ncbi:CheR family methyltransferase [Acetobacter vaccinii]|nr:CheR family methyltransferase [Acetobacter vaccinii]
MEYENNNVIMHNDSFNIVAIGASAGGLEALRDMLAVAKPPTNLAFVIIQHLDPTHESMLAQLLNRTTALDVLQCEGGEDIRTDHVYIIPPGKGLAIDNGRLRLTDFTQPRGLRKPIDDFFASLAHDCQGNAACVILSGTGADGSVGLRTIKEYGGVCIVQDPLTARYDGMPLSAINSGLVDFIKHPRDIISCLETFFQRRNPVFNENKSSLISDYVDSFCSIIKKNIGHDFSHYKRSTFIRRIERRMHILDLNIVEDYLDKVREDQNECNALFRDLLINVTRFFRNIDMFDILRTKVIELLLQDKRSTPDIRVWVSGCSSGEEAYTIAMLFATVAKNLGVNNTVQIFATDIDEQMLQIAREAIYPISSLTDIPNEIAKNFITINGNYFTISNKIREHVRFSNHSIIRDPPFSKIDLISCRNLLIYFDDVLQQQVMPLLHYALAPKGFLFLGPSETIGKSESYFSSIDHHARIFQHSGLTTRYPLNMPSAPQAFPRHLSQGQEEHSNSHMHKDDVAIQKLADRYAPPSMVVSDDGSILAAYGKLSKYFDFPVTREGGSSAFTLARPGLRNIMGSLLRQTRQKQRAVVARNIQIEGDYGAQPTEITCDPLSNNSFLLVFKDCGPFQAIDIKEYEEFEPVADHVDLLEEELRITRHKLRSTIEELETANEELKSSNEEMMSMNEELQSTNEELSTVNDELKNKVDQLTIANSDVKNFFDSTELAVMVVDKDLRIRSFTDATTAIFPLKRSDKGRLLSDVSCKLNDNNYLEDALNVAHNGKIIQRRLHTKDKEKTFSMRILPYRNNMGDISGATIVMTDITEALTLEHALLFEQERLKVAVSAGQIGIWEYSSIGNYFKFDRIHQSILNLTNRDTIKFENFLEIIDTSDRMNWENAIDFSFDNNEKLEICYKLSLPNGERKIFKSYANISFRGENKVLVGATIDVTPEYTLAEARSVLLQEMNHRVKNLFAIIASMVTISARSHSDISVYAQNFRDRIVALGRAHALSVQSDTSDVISLKTLVKTMTDSHNHENGKIFINGPDVFLHSNVLSPLAMILHEWTTNSSKYGVLSCLEGTLTISWRNDSENLNLTWREVCSHPIEKTEKIGFGTTLIISSARQIKAKISKEIKENIYILKIQIPLENIEK